MRLFSYQSSNKDIILFSFLLFLASISLRLPFWFIDIINWDESTFIVMGHSILNGSLLYTEYWDLKPPLAFLSIAAFMTIFGESIISVRFLGALCIFLTSLLLYFISRKFFNSFISKLLSFLCIPIMSFYWEGQSTMTEHIAVPFLLMALYILLLSNHLSYKKSWAIGLLISIASLIRLNIAYISIPIGIVMLIYARNSSWKGSIFNGLVYSLGGVLPIVILIAFYGYFGELNLLFRSIISASLAYSQEQKSLIESMTALVYQLLRFEGSIYITFRSVIFISALVGVICILPKIFYKKDHSHIKLFIFTTALILSTFASGGAYDHYLLQLAPMMILYSGFFLEWLGNFRVLKKSFLCLVFVSLILDSSKTLHEYKNIYEKISKNQPLKNGEAYWAADQIKQLPFCEFSLLPLSHQILYFLLDVKPSRPLSTHPSLITKEYLIKSLYGKSESSKTELDRIMNSNPTIIIRSKRWNFLEGFPDLKSTVMTNLENYKLFAEKDNIEIYVRNNSLPLEINCSQYNTKLDT